jgi:hypothetical protein
MQQSQVDYWTFRGSKKKMICSTPFMTSLRQCTTIFHHLAPEIIDAFGTVRERRHRVHIELGAVRKQERQLRSYLPSTHPVKMNGLSIQSSCDTRSRHLQRFRDRLYTRADEDVGSAGHYVPVKPSTKRLINGRVYTQTNVSRSIWVMTIDLQHCSRHQGSGASQRRLHRRI